MAEQDAANAHNQGAGQVGAGVALPDITNMSVNSEEMPSLADFAHEPSTGAWPDGWYAATLIEGYASNSGYQFITEDQPSKDGNSRNVRICLRATNKAKEERNFFTNLNYRLYDLTPEGYGRVKTALDTAKKEKWKNNAWPESWKDVHRSVIAIQSLAQLERALGFRLKKTAEGTLNVSIFFNQQVDARLRQNEETGYSEVAEFAKRGERLKLYK